MIANELSLQSLRALAQGEILAVHVTDFLTKEECTEIVLASTQSAHFRFLGPGFVALGPAVTNLPYAVSDYVMSAPHIEEILSTPYERIAAILGGLQRPNYDNIELRPLTARFYDTAYRLPPYQEEHRWNYPWAQQSQLSLSINMVRPEAGGQTKLWDHAYNWFEYSRRRLNCKVGLNEDWVPPHDLEIACEVGSLTVFNARRLHAFERVESGARMSIDGYVTSTGSETFAWS